jgi:hypothetical protein
MTSGHNFFILMFRNNTHGGTGNIAFARSKGDTGARVDCLATGIRRPLNQDPYR